MLEGLWSIKMGGRATKFLSVWRRLEFLCYCSLDDSISRHVHEFPPSYLFCVIRFMTAIDFWFYGIEVDIIRHRVVNVSGQDSLMKTMIRLHCSSPLHLCTSYYTKLYHKIHTTVFIYHQIPEIPNKCELI